MNVEKYERLATQVLKVYEEAERVMTRRVAKRLAKGVTEPGWTEKKLAEMRDVTVELRIATEDLMVERRELQRAAIQEAYSGSSAAFASEAEQFAGVTNIAGKTANSTKVVNIMAELDSTMAAADRRILRQAEDAYAGVVGRVSALVATGSTTVREAVRREVNEFARQGITSFVDKAGRHWDMCTYAEMATLTAIERATREGYTDTMQAYGYDLCQISDHYGACPVCEAWQGVVISVSGMTSGYPSMADAEAAGVFHPNCLHDIDVYHEGISRGARSEPDAVREPNPGYTARSIQRSYERKIRQYKREMAAATTPEDERKAFAKVQEYRGRIRDLITDYNRKTDKNVDYLPRKYWREGGRQALSDAAK